MQATGNTLQFLVDGTQIMHASGSSFLSSHDSGNFDPSQTISDSRLIGRSVWNTRWLLIIPGGNLSSDRNEGIQRFINGALKPDGTRDGNGVTDIKIFFQTYAYSGN